LDDVVIPMRKTNLTRRPNKLVPVLGHG
jgi:hypothetical protein